MADLAKLSWNGGSQAVHLPPEYHFDGAEVRIRREGERVILEPVSNDISETADEAEKLAWLREEIRKGYESGEDEDLDVERIKREGRERLEAARRR